MAKYLRDQIGVSVWAGTILWCLLLTGCNLPHLLLGYPRYWDYTKSRPKNADLVGTYHVLKLRLTSDLSRAVKEREPSIMLAADHTATLTNVPEFDGFGDTLQCRLSGSANWSLDDKVNYGWGWSVAFENYQSFTKQRSAQCNYENMAWAFWSLVGTHHIGSIRSPAILTATPELSTRE